MTGLTSSRRGSFGRALATRVGRSDPAALRLAAPAGELQVDSMNIGLAR
jgi:hypothetical protein